jgi:hypothetical protein
VGPARLTWTASASSSPVVYPTVAPTGSWESSIVTRYPASIAEPGTAADLVLTSTEQPDRLDRQLQIYAAAQRAAAIADDLAATALAHEGHSFTERAPQLRRVLVIAAKPALPD